MANDTVPPPPGISGGTLVGAPAIAEFLYGSAGPREVRKVYCLAGHSKLPFFRFRAKLCLRPSALLEVLEKAQEEAPEGNQADADSGSDAGPPEGSDETPIPSEG